MIGLLLAVAIAQARTPGVTVQAWQLEKSFPSYPKVIQGQIANSYFIAPNFDLAGPLQGDGETLSENVFGTATARLAIPESGTYRFILMSSSGAELHINGERVCDTLDFVYRTAPGRAEGQYVLARGNATMRIRFLHASGPLRVRLLMKRPSREPYEMIPPELLSSDAGLTFVTAPGPKKAELGAPTTRPGDGRPLDAVHPSFTLENFRGPKFQPGVGGMAFLPDGRLAICTWDDQGAVYLIDGLRGRNARVKKFASGLGEPLGIAWYQGALYVTQKGEITKLVDSNHDDVADEYVCIASGWPVSQNYHEFTFNLVAYQGAFHITSSVPLRSGQTNYMPGSHGAYSVPDGPGSWISVDPKTGEWKRLAWGMRTPNGMNVGVDGKLFVADNQGSWLPSSALYVMEPGKTYLHPEKPDGESHPENVSLWFPHGEIGNSPSQMVLIPDGPYRGQMLIGDAAYGGLQRVMLEKVGGQYQGAVVKHSQGLEVGVNRLAWGPDGCLYVGGVGSNGDWNHQGHRFGLQRLRPNGKVPFEILEMRAGRYGFWVRFTKPLGDSSQLSKAQVKQWRYKPTLAYGGPKLDEATLPVTYVASNPAEGNAFIGFDDDRLKPGSVVYFNFRGLMAKDGSELWSPEAWYTLNKLGPNDGNNPDRWRVFPDAKPPRGAEVLIGRNGSTKLVRAKDRNRCNWTRIGDALEVVHDPGQTIGGNDMLSPKGHGDIRLHLEWLSPPGGDVSKQFNGNSGVKLQGRYEVQILNTPGIVDSLNPKPLFNEAGSIYRLTAPSSNPSYGPGVWQTYDIWFTAPKWKDGRKISNARATVFWNGIKVHDNAEIATKTGLSSEEAPGDFPLLFQDHETTAEGGVRYRNVWYVKNPAPAPERL